MIWLAVAVGGALGGAARVLIDHWLRPADPAGFPSGILACNVLGSFLVGLVIGWLTPGVDGDWRLPLLATGFCGALTTWSTFALDAVRLVVAGARERAAAYVLASLVGGLAAAYAGLALAA